MDANFSTGTNLVTAVTGYLRLSNDWKGSLEQMIDFPCLMQGSRGKWGVIFLPREIPRMFLYFPFGIEFIVALGGKPYECINNQFALSIYRVFQK